MIKVAYLTHEYNCKNGSTLSLLNMIDSLKEDVKPLVIFPNEGKTVELFKSRGIHCEIVPFQTQHIYNDKFRLLRRFKYVIIDQIKYLKSKSKLSKILLENSIDIVHSNTSVINLGYLVAKTRKIPHIWHIREYIDEDLHCIPLYGFKRLIRNLKNTDATISISKAIQKHFSLEKHFNAYHVYNAVIDEPASEMCEIKEKFFLLAGRLTYEKGVEDAINAFYIFNQSRPGEYKLILIGDIDPSYELKIKKIISDLSLVENIEIKKYTNSLHEYYRKASALIMASRKEGLGRVTIEAMNYGCPVIGYNSGGTSELICHKTTGLLYNSIEECVLMMNEVTDKKIRNNIIKNAKQFSSENFTENKYRERIIKIYNTVINENA